MPGRENATRRPQLGRPLALRRRVVGAAAPGDLHVGGGTDRWRRTAADPAPGRPAVAHEVPAPAEPAVRAAGDRQARGAGSNPRAPARRRVRRPRPVRLPRRVRDAVALGHLPHADGPAAVGSSRVPQVDERHHPPRRRARRLRGRGPHPCGGLAHDHRLLPRCHRRTARAPRRFVALAASCTARSTVSR